MKVVLVSLHDGDSDRKTGFHFWAKILAARGHDVRFLTVGSSYISLLKRGGKQPKRPFNRWQPLEARIRKFTWMPLFHPLNLPSAFLKNISRPLFSLYPKLLPSSLLKSLQGTDLFIIESGQGSMLVPRFAELCPKAKFIYNPSDRHSVIKFHPLVAESEKKALPYFTAIRLNSASVANDFPKSAPTHYIPQAIDKKIFDAPSPNPYIKLQNAINVGDMLFDETVIDILARAHPDWTFHMFGKGARLTTPLPNVIEHGEMPFEKLVPYLQHADIGLAPYKASRQAAYLKQSSLKFVQYTYCKLPIVAPRITSNGDPHIHIYWEYNGPNGVIKAFENALKYDRNAIDRSRITGWEDVVDNMMRIAHV